MSATVIFVLGIGLVASRHWILGLFCVVIAAFAAFIGGP